MAEPVRWAAWRAMGPRPEMLGYPFVLLPAVATGGAWFARQFGNMRLAGGMAFLPVSYLGQMVGWFYLTPQAWR